jgi:peroxiredoxin
MVEALDRKGGKSVERASRKSRLKAGDWFPPIHTKTLHGWSLSVPNGAAPLLHLQFLRFAGSSICNLHLRSFVQRDFEIRDTGVTEVVIFQSSKEELLPYQSHFPFAVIADPKRRLYEQYGVGSSLAALFDPRAWPRLLLASFARANPERNPAISKGSIWGLPAEFLIGESGMVKAAHYGKHVDDRWSVDELLSLARSHQKIRYTYDTWTQQRNRNHNGGHNPNYSAGSRGPETAERSLQRHGRSWGKL